MITQKNPSVNTAPKFFCFFVAHRPARPNSKKAQTRSSVFAAVFLLFTLPQHRKPRGKIRPFSLAFPHRVWYTGMEAITENTIKSTRPLRGPSEGG